MPPKKTKRVTKRRRIKKRKGSGSELEGKVMIKRKGGADTLRELLNRLPQTSVSDMFDMRKHINVFNPHAGEGCRCRKGRGFLDNWP
jgi:hypothetical protein